MNKFTIKGIIVREVPYGDADKLLNIFTRELGLITVSAKYARRPKNNMLFSTSVLTFGEYEISGSESTKYYLSSAQIIESYEPIRSDVVLLTYCAHLMDLILDSMRDISSAEDIFALLLHTLNKITKPDVDYALTVHTFELKLLFILGFMPVLNECIVCGKPISVDDNSKVVFSYSNCGISCAKGRCTSLCGDHVTISLPTLACMKYIANSTIEKVYSFKLEKAYSNELAEVSTRYICDRLERCYTKLKLLEDFD